MKVHIVTSADRKYIYGCFKKKKRAKAYVSTSASLLIISLKVDKSKTHIL